MVGGYDMTDDSVRRLREMPVKTSADQILKAAAKVFHRRGYHGAKVSEITKEAGVAQGTFYLYFPSKEQAFVELMQGFGDKIRDAVLELEWSRVGTLEDLRQQDVDLCVKIFEVCAENRNVAGLFFNATPSADERSMALLEEFMRDIEGIIAQQLVDGMERGYIRSLKAETIARAVVGLYVNIIVRTIIGEGRSHGLRELAEDLVDFELRGIVAWEGTAAK
jgi:AcrR family transcriptional regulator